MRVTYLWVLLGLFVLGGVLSFAIPKALWPQGLSSQDPLVLYSQYSQKIDPLIKEKKYAEAGKNLSTTMGSSTSRRLLLALGSHMGRQIYIQEGPGAIVICLRMAYEVSFGCVHGAASEALARDTQSYTVASRACLSISDPNEQSACVHMVGHVLAARTDYSLNSIIDAMQQCKRFASVMHKDDMASSCTSGVAMEYYVARLGADGKGISGAIKKDTLLKFDSQHPYDICPSLPDKEDCYAHIVSWWLSDAKLTRKEVGALCLGIAEEPAKRECVVMLSRFELGDMTGDLFGEINRTSRLLECKQIVDMPARQACYRSRLIGPRMDDLIKLGNDRCDNLMLGTYTTVCKQMIQSGIDEFDYN